MIGLDSQKYTLKTNTPLDKSCMSFTAFHSDPGTYVIMACEQGTLKIFKPARNLITGSFDIEEAIRQERQQNGVDEDDEESQGGVGDIIEVVPT